MASYVKTGFFTALSGSCRGTDIFLRLKDQKPARALRHLFLLLALCGIAVAVIQNIASADRFGQTSAAFKAAFGGVQINRQEHQVRPLQRPMDSRSMLLPSGGIVTYVPGGVIPSLPSSSTFADFNYLIYWFPGEFIMAVMEKDGGLHAVSLHPADAFAGMAGGKSMTRESFTQMLNNAAMRNASLPQNGSGTATIDGDALMRMVRLWGAVMEFLLFTLGGFVQIIICILIFTGLFCVTGRRQMKNLTFVRFFVCAVYAGFPAVMVASAFPAFNLPVLSFGSAYVTGMILFLLSVINRIERSAREENTNDRQ